MNRATIGLAVVLSALGWGAFAAAASAPGFYFFDPDSPQSNLVGLKGAMDRAMGSLTYRVRFQPFSHLDDLERQIRETPPGLAMLPAWYIHRKAGDLEIVPLLTPTRNGRTTYRKVLLVSSERLDASPHPKGRTLATTTLGPDGAAMLRQWFPADSGLDPGTLDIIAVPKDTDALVALALGQVDLALVVEHNLGQVARANPRITAGLSTLATSKAIPMPQLVFIRDAVTQEQVEELRGAFLSTPVGEGISTVMDMLKIDGWQVHP